MAITTRSDLVTAAAQGFTRQSAVDGTSVTTLRLNPVSYGIATADVAAAAATATVTVQVAAGSTATTDTVTGIVTIAGPQGPQGAPGEQGPRGLPGQDAVGNTIPDVTSTTPQVLYHDERGYIQWYDVGADFKTLKKQLTRDILVAGIIYGA